MIKVGEHITLDFLGVKKEMKIVLGKMKNYKRG